MSEPGRIVVMTTYNTDQRGKGFDELNQATANNLQRRLENLLPQSTITIQRSNGVAWDIGNREPINVDTMGIMIVGEQTYNQHYVNVIYIASRMPLLIMQQVPFPYRFMLNGVLQEDCSDDELLLAIRATFALSTTARPAAVAA